MNFDLSDERAMLAEQVRALLGERSPPDRLRELIDSGLDWDEPLWRELAALGFLGASIAEEHGGLGLGEFDLAVISEQLGRANASVPFFSSIVLAATALRLAGSETQKAEWLPRIVDGSIVAVFAYAEKGAAFGAPPEARYANGRLNGVKTPVADAGIADLAIVTTAEGLALVQLDHSGVARSRLDSFDQLRAHYSLEFENVPAEPLTAAPMSRVLDELFDRAAIQAAFEGIGGAEACLTMARDYAMERRVFGRPLASYQAIKHKLADMFVRLELARSSAGYAAWVATHDAAHLPAAASAARLMAVDAFESAARENIQVHGGIGYTFEANCHFYYRRERTLALSLGDRQHWADRLIAALPTEAV